VGDGVGVDLAEVDVVVDAIPVGAATDVKDPRVGAAGYEDAVVLQAGDVFAAAPPAEPVCGRDGGCVRQRRETVRGNPAGDALGEDAGPRALGVVDTDDLA
jgi:hypothetical protein